MNVMKRSFNFKKSLMLMKEYIEILRLLQTINKTELWNLKKYFRDTILIFHLMSLMLISLYNIKVSMSIMQITENIHHMSKCIQEKMMMFHYNSSLLMRRQKNCKQFYTIKIENQKNLISRSRANLKMEFQTI